MYPHRKKSIGVRSGKEFSFGYFGDETPVLAKKRYRIVMKMSLFKFNDLLPLPGALPHMNSSEKCENVQEQVCLREAGIVC
ncbi:hypothetical protein AVEN_165070-1 [Araneus ventricosus]|uniref:Uncharacterized protein n=1 Tax=Araneus ventricosus TaxID=182803 RepID=A0A4Y2F5E5_ARAVE|nr:hypothetical protein AVEN_165070-1 [Araneus ventricosus]